MLHRSVNHLIETKLSDNEKLGIHHIIPCPIISQFYSGALISASIWWLENDTPISIDKIGPLYRSSNQRNGLCRQK